MYALGETFAELMVTFMNRIEVFLYTIEAALYPTPQRKLIMDKQTKVDVQQHINLLRSRALDKLSVYLSMSVLFLFLTFLYQLSVVDWQDIYVLRCVCFVIATVVIALSSRLNYQMTILCYLGLGLIATAAEYIGLGTQGVGVLASMFCLMLSLFYLNEKLTGIIILIIVVILIVAAYTGKTLPQSTLPHTLWYSVWVGEFVSLAAFFVIIGGSLYHLQNQMFSLLVKVESQKRAIEGQKQCVEHLANHDALTGLPSLRLAEHRLDAVLELAIQKEQQPALLFLDLDGFKTINDQYGHETGDELHIM